MTLAIASFRMTPDLYRQQLSDWTRSVSRRRKWAPHVAIALCGIAILLLILGGRSMPKALPYGVVLGLLGSLTYIDHRREMRKWLKRANSSRVAGEAVEIRFEDDAIYTKGPTTESRTTWNGYERAIPSPNGLFLYTDKGTHIYIPDIPDYALDNPDAKREIVRRFRAAQ